MLKSVFQVTNDRIRMKGTAVNGPTYLIGLAILALLTALVLAVTWQMGWGLDGFGHLASMGTAATGIVLLILAGSLWPAGIIVMDRCARQLVFDRGKATGRRVPLEKVRFEIREIRRWTNLSTQSSWAFVARMPEEPELEVYLSTDRDRVKQLWREMGEWLAAGSN